MPKSRTSWALACHPHRMFRGWRTQEVCWLRRSDCFRPPGSSSVEPPSRTDVPANRFPVDHWWSPVRSSLTETRDFPRSADILARALDVTGPAAAAGVLSLRSRAAVMYRRGVRVDGRHPRPCDARWKVAAALRGPPGRAQPSHHPPTSRSRADAANPGGLRSPRLRPRLGVERGGFSPLASRSWTRVRR